MTLFNLRLLVNILLLLSSLEQLLLHVALIEAYAPGPRLVVGHGQPSFRTTTTTSSSSSSQLKATNLLLDTPLLAASMSAATQTTTVSAVSTTTTSSSSLLSSLTSHWSSSLCLSTIDSDIAQIPENEFAPIFAGGIVVMFGGLISALIVGFILEQNDLYASVIADSYAQGDGATAEELQFWKGLSEEETKKTQQLLEKMRQQKQEQQQPDPLSLESTVAASTTSTTTTTTSPVKESPPVETTIQDAAVDATKQESSSNKQTDMFSDYSN